MTFLEEIKEFENERNNKEDIVINEILDYFKEKMESDSFKTNIKRRIKDKIDKGEKTCTFYVEFWEYKSGCSNTNIEVSGCDEFEISKEKNGSNYDYKGIRLEEIHKKICSELSNILIRKLFDLELRIISRKRRDNEFRFGYYREDITISW